MTSTASPALVGVEVVRLRVRLTGSGSGGGPRVGLGLDGAANLEAVGRVDREDAQRRRRGADELLGARGGGGPRRLQTAARVVGEREAAQRGVLCAVRREPLGSQVEARIAPGRDEQVRHLLGLGLGLGFGCEGRSPTC